jgi:hypothetical protein
LATTECLKAARDGGVGMSKPNNERAHVLMTLTRRRAGRRRLGAGDFRATQIDQGSSPACQIAVRVVGGHHGDAVVRRLYGITHRRSWPISAPPRPASRARCRSARSGQPNICLSPAMWLCLGSYAALPKARASRVRSAPTPLLAHQADLLHRVSSVVTSRDGRSTTRQSTVRSHTPTPPRSEPQWVNPDSHWRIHL